MATCSRCNEWTMKDVCPFCGKKMLNAVITVFSLTGFYGTLFGSVVYSIITFFIL